MLKDLIENGKSIREETKAVLREIKKIPVGNQQRREASRIQISDLEHKEEINIQPKQNEETEFTHKKREFKKTLGHVQRANIQIIGEEQEIENLFEKIMKLP